MKSISFRFRIYLVILALVLFVGMIGLMIIEDFSFLDSFYFIIVSIATVGYGDIHPVTPAGKMLVVGIILAGVGCFVGVVANTIEYMIEIRERTQRIGKLNMLIGVFYSEVGTILLKKFSPKDKKIEEIRSALLVSNNWSDDDFTIAQEKLKKHLYHLDSREFSLEELHTFFSDHKVFLVALLENPQLFEHDQFTDLLHAVFHLAEELVARDHLVNLPEADYNHLSGDMMRLYSQLVIEWLTYMHYQKKKYPYLFSLAMRTNPFNENASAIVE